MSSTVDEKAAAPSQNDSLPSPASSETHSPPKGKEFNEKDDTTGDDAGPTKAHTASSPDEGSSQGELVSKREDGKIELDEYNSWEDTAFAWSGGKKWWVLTVIAFIQLSMNFNTSVWPNALMSVESKFSVTGSQARTTQMVYLVAYAFGSEAWAPFSEEFGRWPIIQLSMFLINVWQLLGVFAPNFGALVVARGLGGFSTAGGSVTLGMVADLYDVDAQQYAIAYVVLSSVGGTSIGPVIGGFIQSFSTYNWIFWVQLIFGGATQLLHLFTVPESRSTIMLDMAAKRRRKAGETNVYGPNELKEARLTPKMFLQYIIRPFEMFVREPIVLSMSLLSGFSDALIFTFLEAFQYVFKQWNFKPYQIGLAYVPINLGYLIGFLIFMPFVHKQRKIRRAQGNDALSPESRLWPLLYLAPLEPLGLFGFAWTSLGPPNVHWIAPMIFSVPIAIANYSIYMATIDYMVAAYGEYSASATGGNALARDFLAGVSALYAVPMYTKIPSSLSYSWASTILGVIGIFVIIPVYWLYKKGPYVRENSKFAQSLAAQRKDGLSRRKTTHHGIA
ncbi:unnamed protein product [Sympodiomycopsis kandeliae]